MKTDKCGMVVEVGVNSCGVSIIFGEPEMLRKEHECIRNRIVDISVPIPILSILVILWVIAPPWFMYVLNDSIEEVANKDSPCKRRVRRALECFVQSTRFHGLPVHKCKL